MVLSTAGQVPPTRPPLHQSSPRRYRPPLAAEAEAAGAEAEGAEVAGAEVAQALVAGALPEEALAVQAVDLAAVELGLPAEGFRFQVDRAQQRQLCISYPSESQYLLGGW